MFILDIDHRLFLCESFIWFQGGTELEVLEWRRVPLQGL